MSAAACRAADAPRRSGTSGMPRVEPPLMISAMKLILSAHVLVVGCGRTQHEVGEALRALGITRVTNVGNRNGGDDAHGAGGVDVVVVVGDAPAEPVQAGLQRHIPPAPGRATRVPCILLIPDPTRNDVRLANAAGFDAVVALPLVPRVLYRRIGSLMQRARRQERIRPSAGYAGGPVMLDAAAEAER